MSLKQQIKKIKQFHLVLKCVFNNGNSNIAQVHKREWLIASVSEEHQKKYIRKTKKEENK